MSLREDSEVQRNYSPAGSQSLNLHVGKRKQIGQLWSEILKRQRTAFLLVWSLSGPLRIVLRGFPVGSSRGAAIFSLARGIWTGAAGRLSPSKEEEGGGWEEEGGGKREREE